MTARAGVVSSRAIYDGRRFLGEVAELANGQFRASDSDGRQIGQLFDKLAEASHAVWEASGRVGFAGVDHA
jgi:hypothetical protein